MKKKCRWWTHMKIRNRLIYGTFYHLVKAFAMLCHIFAATAVYNLDDVGHTEQGVVSQVLWLFRSQTLWTACPTTRPYLSIAIHIFITSLTEQFHMSRWADYTDTDTDTWTRPHDFKPDGYSDTDTGTCIYGKAAKVFNELVNWRFTFSGFVLINWILV